MSKEEKDGSKVSGNVWIGFVVTFIITFLGLYSNNTISNIASEDRKLQIENNDNIARRAENNRKDQIQIEMISNREIASSNMRVQMFKTLMDRYFNEDNATDTKIAILELIGLNFQNHLYLKPLFLQLNEELLNNNKAKEKLRKVGRAINRFEINDIVGNGGTVERLKLKLNETLAYKTSYKFYFQLLDITEDYIRISTNKEDKDGFEVTFFDTPFMDNSSNSDYTYSILLSDVDLKAQKATIKLVEFPDKYLNTRNKMYTDSIITSKFQIDSGIVDKTQKDDNSTVDITEANLLWTCITKILKGE